MSVRCSLALALAAVLVASAAAALPGPFANEGGPDFLNGPMYRLDNETGEPVTMGIIHDGTYSFAEVVDGTVRTEKGVYTSWECVQGKPGYYNAIVNITYIDWTGEVIESKVECEHGTVFTDSFENYWSTSTTECPTTAEYVDHFFAGASPDRNVTNTCGTPAHITAPGATDMSGLEGLIKP